ncbi:LAFA_0G23310g1_1 [Lachancea sp. 'fantastica']|nr:LAFA_0G23310g1_1 [Lachancea sp. 'fantastica']
MKGLCIAAFLFNCIHVCCLQQDKWAIIAKNLALLPKHEECLIDSAQDWDPYQGGINITLPIDYYEEEQEHIWAAFIASESHSNRLMFSDLVQSSETFNNTEATYTLSQILLQQQYGVPQSKSLAFYFLQKFNNLTDYANASAVFEEGVMHTTGLFGTIPVNIPQGLILYEKAAALGDPRAIMALAYRYYKGINVPQDDERALILYRGLASDLRESYTDLEWEIFHPYVESYYVRIPDFTGGLLGSDLSRKPSTVTRLRANRPDITTPGYSILNGQGARPGPGYHYYKEDDDDSARLMELYYTALDNYMGTYTQRRNLDAAVQTLNSTIQEFSPQIKNMDTLQKFYYGRCLELLGHMLFTGQGFPTRDLDAAESILLDAVSMPTSFASLAHLDLGTIEHYFHKNATAALQHYENSRRGESAFQLHQLFKSGLLSKKKNMPMFSLKDAVRMGQRQAFYELALETEESAADGRSTLVQQFKRFVESQEQQVAPHMKDAFLSLLRGETEAALWLYALAAEQGIGIAQINAAFILHQPPYSLDEPPISPVERKHWAARYYSLASLGNTKDALIVAGDIYFQLGDYERSAAFYESDTYSPLGRWNLGYMHEYGLGVEQDFRLAKKYYGKALEFNPELVLGVKLSILKLQLKSWFAWLTRSAERFGWLVSAETTSKRTANEALHSRLIKKLCKTRYEKADPTIITPNYYGLPTLKDAVLIIGLFAIFLIIQFARLARGLLARRRRNQFGGINFPL